MKNKALHIIFGILNIVFSWGVVVVYAAVKYGAYLAARGAGLATMFTLALGLGLWGILRSLKDTAENGYGLSKEIARAVRFVIPFGVAFALVLVLDKNIAGIADLLKVFFAGNLVAVPCRLVSYWMGPRYIRDISGNRIIEILESRQ